MSAREVGGGLIGVGMFDVEGDAHSNRPLFTEPYIEAVVRTDEYHGVFLRHGSTLMSAGRFMLHATVDEIVAVKPTATIYARVLEGNPLSQTMFDDERWDALPRDAFDPPTEQIIRRRTPKLIIPPGCWSVAQAEGKLCERETLRLAMRGLQASAERHPTRLLRTVSESRDRTSVGRSSRPEGEADGIG